MEHNEILHKIDSILDATVENISPVTEALSTGEKLGIVLSESLQALYFVTTIEDEFDITFEDSEIDLNFFQDVHAIVQKIQIHILRKNEQTIQ